MNGMDLLHTYFDAASAAHLGRVVGLDAATTQRALSVGLPLQLSALAEHAGTADGQRQLGDAATHLPRFGSVEEALRASEGAHTLQQAGELLAPVLLGGQAQGVAAVVVGEAGGVSRAAAEHLMHLTLPLVLSFLAQRGVKAGDIAALAPTLHGGVGRISGEGQEGAASTVLVASVAGEALSGPAPDPAPTAVPTPSPTPPETLLDVLKSQFGGAAGEKIGAAAGFSGSAAPRATLAALPLVLNALVNKGRTESGAQDLSRQAQGFGQLTADTGNLNLGFLADSAEVTRVEGQGRQLLGQLFSNVDEVTGRLGSALGSSGSNAGRLLSLLGPLVLAFLGRRVQSNRTAGGLGGLLSDLGGGLAGLLPAGLGGLAALLGPGADAAVVPSTASRPAPGAISTTTLTAAPDTSSPVAAAPAAPRPAPVATAVPTAAPVPAGKRGGFPWWLIPLALLLLLGGCWLTRPQDAAAPATTTATPAARADGIVVENPASGATLPAEPFTLSGTAPAGAELTVRDAGGPVGTATVGPDGQWSAEVPAPTPGEHTYTVEGGGATSEFSFNVAGEAGVPGTDITGTDTSGAGAAPISDGTFTITEPLADAELPGGGFALKGTGAPGDSLQLFEDGTSLGNVTVGEDGLWAFDVPSPSAGAHIYAAKDTAGDELGRVAARIAAPASGATAASCDKAYTLSITDGQTVNEPFRFGGVGAGKGYAVTVKRGARTIGTKTVPLDASCGWSYQSRPGRGTITYEVRPLGDAAAEPLSTVDLTVVQ